MLNMNEIVNGMRGAIFDLDGVIVDTAKYHYLAWKRLANTLGFEFTEQQNEQLKGVSRQESLEILLAIGNIHCSESIKEAYLKQKNDWYLEYIGNMNEEEILPHVIPFIQQLKSNQIKIALGSSSKNALMILERLHILHYFDVLVDGNKTPMAKPAPDIFALAAKEMGLECTECVVFEDAAVGIQAAKAAGMKVIGIGEHSVLHEADVVIPNLQPLLS